MHAYHPNVSSARHAEIGADFNDEGCGLCSYLKSMEGPVLCGIECRCAKHFRTADESGRRDGAIARYKKADNYRTRDMGCASDWWIDRLWARENERGDIHDRQLTYEIARSV
jgi:hypothetical protein